MEVNCQNVPSLIIYVIQSPNCLPLMQRQQPWSSDINTILYLSPNNSMEPKHFSVTILWLLQILISALYKTTLHGSSLASCLNWNLRDCLFLLHSSPILYILKTMTKHALHFINLLMGETYKLCSGRWDCEIDALSSCDEAVLKKDAEVMW